jgi:hypothetical protein
MRAVGALGASHPGKKGCRSGVLLSSEAAAPGTGCPRDKRQDQIWSTMRPTTLSDILDLNADGEKYRAIALHHDD